LAAATRDPAIRIGISGWSYPKWRAGFYKGVPQRRWLQYCAERFNAVEVNATFYRALKPEIYGRWHDETPADFAFAVKGHRMVTHVLRLTRPHESLQRQRDSLAPLGEKIAAVVWQLPASLQRDDDRLAGVINAFGDWPGPRHAIEFRHESWFCAAVADRLAEARAANCLSDSPRWPMWRKATTDLVYVRLHGNPQLYTSKYEDKALRGWARLIRRWRREGRAVHVYFDNDSQGHAPFDALRLTQMLDT
jgi:uncharacterized protein YecE (DUF72 family)